MVNIESRVISNVEKLKNELISTTKSLVSIPTINPPGQNYEPCVNYLSDVLKEAGLSVKILRVPENRLQELAPEGEGLPRPNLIAELSGKRNKTLHFNGHYDVVPATDSRRINSFKPIIKNNKIYGRGSSDMKGAIAAMIIAAKAIVQLDINLNGSLQISAVPDEENDGLGGTNFIIENKEIKADYCIIGEPSGIHNVWNAHKGQLWMQLVILGEAAHGSTPWRGVNAFEKAVQVVNSINNTLKPRLARRVSSYATAQPEGRGSTINVGGIVETGKAVNIVPDRCLITIDRRLIPEETLDEAKNEFIDLLKELQSQDPELKFETKITSQYNACLTPSDSQICTATVDAIQSVTGIRPTTTMCVGGLDMRHFVKAGIPTVAYGPGDLRLAHSADEHVEIQELVTVAKVYAISAMRILGISD